MSALLNKNYVGGQILKWLLLFGKLCMGVIEQLHQKKLCPMQWFLCAFKR